MRLHFLFGGRARLGEPWELVALRVASHVPWKWNGEMLSCFPEFSPFPCKAQAVVCGLGHHSGDGTPGWCTASVIPSGPPAPHFIYPTEWIKILPLWAWRIDFSCDSSPAFPLSCCPCSDSALELLASASPSPPRELMLPALPSVLLILCQDPRGDWEQAAPLPTQGAL